MRPSRSLELRELPESYGDGSAHWFDLPIELRAELTEHAAAWLRRYERRWLALRAGLMVLVLAAIPAVLFLAPLPVWSAPLLGVASGWALARAWRVGRLPASLGHFDEVHLALSVYHRQGPGFTAMLDAMVQWAAALDDPALRSMDARVLQDRLLLQAGLCRRLERHLASRLDGPVPDVLVELVLGLAAAHPGSVAEVCELGLAAWGAPVRPAGD